MMMSEEKKYIIDTCFIIYELKEGKTKKLEEFCKLNKVFLTDFTLLELKHVEKKVSNIKHYVEHFLKEKLFELFNTNIHPGEWEQEKEYLNSVDEELLKKVSDASDGVIVAAAIKIGAIILTRDKHHIFTTNLENELKKYNISVLNNFPD